MVVIPKDGESPCDGHTMKHVSNFEIKVRRWIMKRHMNGVCLAALFFQTEKATEKFGGACSASAHAVRWQR